MEPLLGSDRSPEDPKKEKKEYPRGCGLLLLGVVGLFGGVAVMEILGGEGPTAVVGMVVWIAIIGFGASLLALLPKQKK